MMRIWRTAVDSRAMKRIQAAEYSRRKPGKTKAGGSWGYQRTSMVEAWSRSSQKLSNPQSLWWGQQVCCSLLRGQRQWPEMPSKCFHRIWPARGTLRDMFQMAVVVALGFNTGIVSSATTYGMKGKKGEEEGQRKRRKRFEERESGSASNRSPAYPSAALLSPGSHPSLKEGSRLSCFIAPVSEHRTACRWSRGARRSLDGWFIAGRSTAILCLSQKPLKPCDEWEARYSKGNVHCW